MARVTSDRAAQVEQASVLAESALSAATQALATAQVAESAAVEASLLARAALDAAQFAYDHAEQARTSA